MAFITSTEMFKKALDSNYAVGAFNVNNMEIVQGIVDAAKEEKAPLILQVSAGAREYALAPASSRYLRSGKYTCTCPFSRCRVSSRSYPLVFQTTGTGGFHRSSVSSTASVKGVAVIREIDCMPMSVRRFRLSES